jgi:uncharacterized protein
MTTSIATESPIHKWARACILALASFTVAGLAWAASACSTPTPKVNVDNPIVLPTGMSFTRRALLESTAASVRTLTTQFNQDAAALAASVDQLSGDETATSQARTAWRTASTTWQQLEVAKFGPMAPAARAGGKDLRDAIYAWPLGSRCLAEQLVVSGGYKSAEFAEGLVSTRGLLALEYLLFYEGSDNACAATASINSSGSWQALSAQERDGRKRDYAKVLARDVAARAKMLATAWSTSGDNFGAQLTNFGTPSAVFTSEANVFNEIVDALFYIEFEVKDMKVARPIGVLGCTSVICPDALESQYAGASKAHIRNNLVGLRTLLLGSGPNGLGFDDYLTAVGAADTAAKLVAAMDACDAALHAIVESDLATALTSNRDAVVALHSALKSLAVLLKTEFITILDFELPKRIETDND